MNEITSISPERIARFNEWSEKWINVGLSTEPANFEAANKAALQAYKLYNLNKPQIILNMSSQERWRNQ